IALPMSRLLRHARPGNAGRRRAAPRRPRAARPRGAAIDIEHAFPVEADEFGDAAVSTPASSRLSTLGLRLVGLDGGPAGPVLLCLAAGVFEGGAGVGVDELTGFDPLESVAF